MKKFILTPLGKFTTFFLIAIIMGGIVVTAIIILIFYIPLHILQMYTVHFSIFMFIIGISILFISYIIPAIKNKDYSLKTYLYKNFSNIFSANDSNISSKLKKRKFFKLKSLKSYFSENINNISSAHDSNLKLTYFSQRYDDKMQDTKYHNLVSYTEAKEIIENFYANKFKKGDVFVIGFTDPDIYFYELTKDDAFSGKHNKSNSLFKNNEYKVDIIRIEEENYNIYDEKFTKDEAMKALNVFWNSFKN